MQLFCRFFYTLDPFYIYDDSFTLLFFTYMENSDGMLESGVNFSCNYSLQAFETPHTHSNCFSFLRQYAEESFSKAACLVVPKSIIAYPQVWRGQGSRKWKHGHADGFFVQFESPVSRKLWFVPRGITPFALRQAYAAINVAVAALPATDQPGFVGGHDCFYKKRNTVLVLVKSKSIWIYANQIHSRSRCISGLSVVASPLAPSAASLAATPSAFSSLSVTVSPVVGRLRDF
ncbi:hypothetical protein KSP40_PGU011567 [Platanthera guangdongensis]|uniref:Uncharacterized protein n=1 Tax=Platanthera guangdongensis TaxID=2320717 RepID=A0ABR2LX80_9ASPA